MLMPESQYHRGQVWMLELYFRFKWLFYFSCGKFNFYNILKFNSMFQNKNKIKKRKVKVGWSGWQSEQCGVWCRETGWSHPYRQYWRVYCLICCFIFKINVLLLVYLFYTSPRSATTEVVGSESSDIVRCGLVWLGLVWFNLVCLEASLISRASRPQKVFD